MLQLKVALVSALALGGAATLSSASAMPIGDLGAAAATAGTNTQEVRWVCGPYRCRWVPNYVVGPRVWGPPVGYGFYGPRPWPGHRRHPHHHWRHRHW